jgi:drug/metabolite transporter (DMT)-like permease
MSDSIAQALLERRQLKHAKMGIFAGFASGLLWGASGTVLNLSYKYVPFTLPENTVDSANFKLYVAMMAAFSLCGIMIHDTFAAFWVGVNNVRAGKFKEYGRTLRTRAGKLVCLGAILGGPVGMGGSILGFTLVSSNFAMVVTMSYPALAAILATFIFRERNSISVWLGLALCFVGSFLIYYVPHGEGLKFDIYYAVGLILATLASVGWSGEGLLATYGMDTIDPDIALGIREIVSAVGFFVFFILIVIFMSAINPDIALRIREAVSSTVNFNFVKPIVTFFKGLITGSTPIWDSIAGSALPFYVLAGFLGGFSYVYWYRALNMAGVARAMALNVTSAFWGLLFGALFSRLVPPVYHSMGAALTVMGAILVSINPRELFRLREVKRGR